VRVTGVAVLPPLSVSEFPQAGEEEARAGKEAAARTERMKQRTPGVDLRRVAEEDVGLRGVGLREVWRQD
jgi:hypothetical protein